MFAPDSASVCRRIASVVFVAVFLFSVISVVDFTSREVAAGSEPSSLSLYWPNSSVIMNQTSKNSASDGVALVGQGTCAWDINQNTQGGIYHSMGIGVMSGGDSRRNFQYSCTAVGDTNTFDSLWNGLIWGQNVDLPLHGGDWYYVGNAAPFVFYGAFYDMVYITSHGVVVPGSSTDWVVGSKWMRGAETDWWNYSFPTVGAAGEINGFLAPLVEDFNPTAIPSNGGIKCGYVTNQGFVVAWKNVPNARGTLQSFCLIIHPLVLTGASTPGIAQGGLSQFEFVWKYVDLSDRQQWRCGIEDQAAEHPVSLVPGTGWRASFSANTDAYKVIKRITVTYVKEKFVSGQWLADDKSGVGVGDTAYSVPGGINVDLADPNIVMQYPGLSFDTILAAAKVLSAVFVVVLSGGTAVPVLLTVGGGVMSGISLVEGLVKDFTPVSRSDDADQTWDAPEGISQQDIKMFAHDEAGDFPFAWDVQLQTYLTWNMQIDNSLIHKLTISTKVEYGPTSVTDSKDANFITGGFDTSTSYTIGPAQTPDKTVTWYSRTIPDGYSSTCGPIAVDDPTVVDKDGIRITSGYFASSTGPASGYDFMGWTYLSKDLSSDLRVRDDGTIRVEGWFKLSDTLPSKYQGSGRLVRLYVMYSDDDGDGQPDGSNRIAQYTLLTGSESYNKWTFRSVSIGSLVPGKHIKIGIGRPDGAYGDYGGTLAVYWAGVKCFCKKLNVDVIEDEYAVRMCNLGNSVVTAGTTSPKDNCNPPAYSSSVWRNDPLTITRTDTDQTKRIGFWQVNPTTPAIYNSNVFFGQSLFIQNVLCDMTVYVQFIESGKRALWTQGDAEGTVTPTPGVTYVQYSETEKSSVTATPYTNCVFTAWYVNGIRQTATTTTIQVDRTSDWFVQADCTATSTPPPPRPGCVAEGTMVTMADGSLLNIAKLKVGDRVLGYDVNTKSFVTETVAWLSSARVDTILNINDDALRVTMNDQPMYVRTPTFQGWVDNPSEIQIGWQLLNLTTNAWDSVYALDCEQGKTKVYDFQTDGPQTYLANGYLVLDKGHR